MAGDHHVESGKKPVIISFALGFLSCVVVIYVWQAVRKEESTMRDDILNGRLKIKLANKLRKDEKACKELVELLEDGIQLTNAVQYWEENVRQSEIALIAWEEIYKNSYLECLERLARFALERRDTTAALTAKLVYPALVPYLTGYGPITEEDERRSDNCDALLKEIIRENPKTWQGFVAASWLARYATDDSEEHYLKEVRILKESLEKENTEPVFDANEFKAYDLWIGFKNGQLEARILHTLALSQHNLGTLGGQRAVFWLHRTQDTYQELLRDYPEYCKHNYISKKDILKIEQMIEEQRRKK